MSRSFQRNRVFTSKSLQLPSLPGLWSEYFMWNNISGRILKEMRNLLCLELPQLLSGNQLVLPQTSANLTHEEQLAICLLGIVANGAVSSEQAYNAIFEASLRNFIVMHAQFSEFSITISMTGFSGLHYDDILRKIPLFLLPCGPS
ncbi:hypothetical protein WN943_023349 [Citrus x changshan-huyou]